MKGTIIGDIIGSPYEFAEPPVKTKTFAWFAPGCHVTDDTVMTIAVAAALMEGKETRQGYIGPLRRYILMPGLDRGLSSGHCLMK